MTRFNSKWSASETGCWIWTASHCRFGHGRFWINGRTTRAHRVSWEMHRGAIPEGLCVLHACDVPACVNPDHLFLGTQIDNVADMDKKSRRSIRRGEKCPWSKLSSKQVESIRQADGTQKEIALRFGVSQPHVCDIRNFKKWQSA